jgi:hypothetical protein
MHPAANSNANVRAHMAGRYHWSSEVAKADADRRGARMVPRGQASTWLNILDAAAIWRGLDG